MLTRHPIVSATFSGHEHSQAYVHIDSSRIANVIGHEWEMIHSGAAGAGTYSCESGRSDWCQATQGFATILVSGNTFTVSWYAKGNPTPIMTRSFTK